MEYHINKLKQSWQDGPPPHVGWWLCFTQGREIAEWRWWEGSFWGLDTYDTDPIDLVTRYAAEETNINPKKIRWCHYWPENARVPRMNPEN